MALLDLTRSPHGGRQRHLPEWQSQPPITPTTIIDHSIVGSAESAYQKFRDQSVLESHFIVDLDGAIWQLMDTDRQADANLRANSYAISIETADRGDPDTQPWTPAQLETLIWLHEEIRRVHPTIPRRRSQSCDDPAGLGFHTMHGAPGCWTPVSKTCPGVIRKRQWGSLLLPAFLAAPQEDDMTDDEHDALMWLRTNVTILRDQGVRMTAFGQPTGDADREVNNLATVLRELKDVKALLAKLLPPE